jgi:hypothetical protein
MAIPVVWISVRKPLSTSTKPSWRSSSGRLHVKAVQCPNWSRARCACCSALNESGEESPPCRHSEAAAHSSMLPTATPCTKPWKAASARRRHQCAGLRRRCRLAVSSPLPRSARTPTGATGCLVHHLGDPLRVSTRNNPPVGHATAWSTPAAWGFVTALLASPCSSRHNDTPTSPRSYFLSCHISPVTYSTTRTRLFSRASMGSGESAPGTPISINFRSSK